MRIFPREQDKLLLHQAGYLAQKRLARGLRLNQTEAVALIASQLHELIRDGKHSVADLAQHGKRMLGRRHVLPGVPILVKVIQVEGTFVNGVFLVTVRDPICTEDGNLAAALYGSFLPIPSADPFSHVDTSEFARDKAPGAVIAKKERITLNKNRKRIKLKVTNNGDRPVQIGSHYHFIETNSALDFDRGKAYGKRLDIAAGASVRFEPSEVKTVTLVDIGGTKIITGGNRLATGVVDPSRIGKIVVDLVRQGFAHTPEPGAMELEVSVHNTISRENYVSLFGPTVGDRVRLGDTSLWIEVERDMTTYGDELKFGTGKTLREGMGQATDRSSQKSLDLVITNALIIDWSGIYKADIGVRDGIIAGIGKAGNPDVMDGVDENLVVGSSTEAISGEKLIVTAGAIDVHCHYICPQQIPEALASGTTTMIGGGTGPASGTNATTCTPSPFYMRHMLAATDGLPMNFGFTGKGSDSGPTALEEIVKAGACGLKLHEDWGATPAAITNCLAIGKKYDVQVNIHTDTMNESGFLETTLKAFGSHTIHAYHTEGAGGGHAPDIIAICERPRVLPSSTNPTRPYAKDTPDEHLEMIMVAHNIDSSNPEDILLAESRVRAQTMAAEDALHDIGAISMISSDSQAMGRVGEVVSRTWRTASKMRELMGPLTSLGDSEGCDNGRVKRYISKYTINPAITHGISHLVGQIAVGQVADLVLWKFENFGAKPEIVLKSGVIAWSQIGEPNGSIPTVQPFFGRPMWGAYAASAALNSISFVSEVSIANGTIAAYGLAKRVEPVRDCCEVTKDKMKWNDATPQMRVDPETFEVFADDEPIHTTPPADTVPLARFYNLF
ncbi:uncharacterized protein PHACADRAFT_250654 [Phanerochaete carnosa HHB-10118-sp]|uniref:Urease n=1 Tax=Phanerochaete carnosa (strain HHB-10118-sp) TaxID=650164 RepID=K5WL42_PHACS|nr:uncharacterized protein PHACADRAFT_250654 [Phanerochaete carnosa HHB-10118-sp]EKM59874.1 hypothetical protein PHACADRAFT_250654 [Phanerochaete carnosa HHB-10118-sp]